jgi:hypothetical protein
MRLALSSVVVCMLAGRGDACPDVDETFVQGSGAHIGRGESKPATVPPRPSFFVHLGRDSGPEMPVFTALDGTVIPYAHVETLDAQWNLLRVDLATEAGRILVRYPGASEPSTYVVDPHFKPATRSTEVRGAYNTLVIDSDAVVLRLERVNGRCDTFFNWGGFDLDPNDAIRVVAVYSNRTEELIFDYRPPHREPDNPRASSSEARQAESIRFLLLLSLLGALLLVTRRIADSRGTRSSALS